ncbi:MAG: MATE family efflux transporter [Christensenellaceae bacterium]|nr:MATE family efflux transporter [Christensenellaceae bacterium]
MTAINTELFERAPIRRAVLTLAVPTVISQLITVVYNVADTFFIGQLGDPAQVAAATLAMPPFILLTGIANLFGIGGASLVSRSLGTGDPDKARQCASFSLWTGAAAALLYGLIMMIFRPAILPAIGAGADTYDALYRYVFWTITVGALPTVLSAELAHLIRAEGYAKQASFGIGMGGVLNILLDPLFIFAFRLGITGAAIATMLSNLAAMGYFLLLLRRKHGATVISLHPRHYTLRRRIPAEILLVGFPSFVMNGMSILSNVILNRLVASYASEAIAGMGVAKKIDMVAFAIAGGMTQGVLPLIGYNYAAKNAARMRAAIRTALTYSLVIACAGTVLLFAGAAPVSRLFIDDDATVAFGRHFLRVICLTCPTVSVTIMLITVFQATGRKLQPTILSLLRKGGLDVPFMFLMNALLGAGGIAWATPIADLLAMFAALALFIPFWRKLDLTASVTR